ncbi:hypothetical protein B0H12DRAFT_1107079 [Mycena haematopus]|nr:hypothetical protein B0H12DRAFT_1107079 [Mycena haematopus]
MSTVKVEFQDDPHPGANNPWTVCSCGYSSTIQRLTATSSKYNTTALNRQGRAICRIMSKHGWSTIAIGYIFRVTPRRLPNERLSEDLDKAGPAFREDLPRPPSGKRLLELMERRHRRSAKKIMVHRVNEDEDERDAAEKCRKINAKAKEAERQVRDLIIHNVVS